MAERMDQIGQIGGMDRELESLLDEYLEYELSRLDRVLVRCSWCKDFCGWDDIADVTYDDGGVEIITCSRCVWVNGVPNGNSASVSDEARV